MHGMLSLDGSARSQSVISVYLVTAIFLFIRLSRLSDFVLLQHMFLSSRMESDTSSIALILKLKKLFRLMLTLPVNSSTLKLWNSERNLNLSCSVVATIHMQNSKSAGNSLARYGLSDNIMKSIQYHSILDDVV